jgi:hypothetical protein
VGIAPKNIAPTYGLRLSQYKRRELMVTWLAAGLAALIVLVTSTLAVGAPVALTAAAATLILFGAGILALARVQFEWAATVLERAIDEGTRALPEGHQRLACAATPDEFLPQSLASWPKLGEVCWVTGFFCVPLAACVYLTAVWWVVATK